MSKKAGVRAKVRAHVKARERGKVEYKRADEMLEELLALGMKPGEEVKFDTTGRKALLKDNFAKGNTAYRAHGIRRFEIEVIEP
jgi:hypothetical protein